MGKREQSRRAKHPLVVLLRTIRVNHMAEVSAAYIETCMGIPQQTLHHIEGGRHLLPNVQQGLGTWLRKYLHCVRATPEEVRQVEELAARIILLEFSDELDEGKGPTSSS